MFTKGKLTISEVQNFTGTLVCWVECNGKRIFSIREQQANITKEQFEANAAELVKRWNFHDALVKIKELGYEVACTGDQEAEDKLIGLIEDYEAALAAAKE